MYDHLCTLIYLWNLTTKRISQPHSTAVFSNRHKEVGKFPRCLKILASTFHAFLQAACEADFGGFWPSPWNTGHRGSCSASSSWHDFHLPAFTSINKDWLFDAKIGQERKCKQFFTNARHCSIPGRKNPYKLARQGTSATSMIKRDPANDCEIFKQSRRFIFDEESKGMNMNMAVPFNSSICLCLRPWVCWSSSHAHSWDSLCQQGFWRLPADQGLCHICPPTPIQSPSTWLQLHSVNVVTAHQSVDSIYPSLWDMHKGSREQPWKYGGAHDSRPALGLWIEISEWSPPMKSLPFCLCRLLASLQHVSCKSTSPVQMQTSQGHGMQTSTVTVSMRKERPPLGTACAWFTPISVRKYPCRNYLSLYDWRKCVFRFRQ